MTTDRDATDNPVDTSRLAGFLKDALRNLARPGVEDPFVPFTEALVRYFPSPDVLVCAKMIPAADRWEILHISGPSAPLAGDLPPPSLSSPFGTCLDEAFRHGTPVYWKTATKEAGDTFSGWAESLNLSFFALYPLRPATPKSDAFLLLGAASSACFQAIDGHLQSLIIHLASLCLASRDASPPVSGGSLRTTPEVVFQETDRASWLDALPDPVFLCETDGTIRAVNRAFKQALGNENTIWTGKDWGAMLSPPCRAEWERFLKNLSERANVFSKDLTLPTFDGSGHLVRLSVSMWKDVSGQQGLLGTFSDISAQIRLENHLKESEEKYRRMFQFAPDGLFLADPDTLRVLEGNPIFADMTGDHFRERLREQSLVSLWEIAEKELRVLIDRLRHSGSPIQNLRRKLRRKDGTLLHTSANLTLIPGEKGETLLVQIRDVTGQTEAEGINRILSTLDRMLLAGSPVDSLLEVILQGLQDLFPFFSTQFFAPNPDGSIRLLRSASRSEEYLAVSRELVSSLRWNAGEDGKTSIGMSIKSHRTRIMDVESFPSPRLRTALGTVTK